MEPRNLSIAEASRLIAARELSPVDLTQSVLDRAAAVEEQIHAFQTLTADAALEQARVAEAEIARGQHRGPLHGIPIGVKDLYATAGDPTTASSRLLADNVTDFDAAAVERLREAGAVIVGKTRTHEFAFGITSDPVRNPRSLEHIPGGSSGGSAAAVVARECLGALGSDTGGSIRMPAALSGATGIKPTFGRVSRHGMLPLGWSLDTAGPIGRDVEDLALLLQAIAGYDPRDPGSLDVPVPDFSGELGRGVEGLRLGLPTNHFWHPIATAVESSARAAIARLQGAGAEIVEVELPLSEYYAPVGWAICLSEAATYHKPALVERGELFGMDVRSQVEVGQFVLATDYVRAQRVRRMIKDAWRALFERERLDAVVAPTLPATAPRVGQQTFTWPDGTEEDTTPPFGRASLPANITGLPALSVPCGADEDGLPIGLQVIGRPLAEATVLAIGRAYERAAGPEARLPEPLIGSVADAA
jgi:aspartyl-tRNA(Asn)/glutamyl-tRNA(Gln) amidotransferase subunit A